MRLHLLTIEAFGPFGEVVEIDFEELNSAGQFLISGATGSGKTSILDAVCFALYGEVPGERQRARHLRSDHAAAGAEPRVTLTLTVAERLIRISRSPAWERPKRRGTGTTQQQASVRLEQQVDGEWQCLATRLDEAGHLINTWLGMTPVQFTQVVLLPQGGFQTFLQSPTAARQAVLQRLFRTDRFERVERWFGDFRRTLNRSVADALHAIDVITHRLAEAAGEEEPPRADRGVDDLEAWAGAVALAARESHEAALIAQVEARSAHDVASRQFEETAALVGTLDRADTAQRQLDELQDTASAFADEVRALRAHESACSLAPLIRASVDAATVSTEAGERAVVSLAAVGLAPHQADELDDLLTRAATDVQRAQKAMTLAESLEGARKDLSVAAEGAETAAAAHARAEKMAAALPQERTKLNVELQRAVEARVDLAACTIELRAATIRLDAARELEMTQLELAAKLDMRRDELEVVQELRQAYQDAREERIEAMASELAVGLVVGCSCPVCGSTAHPSPASAAGGVGRRAEERARRKFESAGVQLAALDEVIAATRARVSSLTEVAAGIDVAEGQRLLDELQGRASTLTTLAEAVEPLQVRIAEIDEQLQRVSTEVDELAAIASRAGTAHQVLAARVRELASDLEATLGEHQEPQDYLAAATAMAQGAKAALAARSAHQGAEASAVQQLASLDLQAASLGFDSGTGAQAALLEDDVAQDIAARERDRAQTEATALAIVSDPRVIEAVRSPRPDLAAAQAAQAAADDRLATTQAGVQVSSRRVTRIDAIGSELRAAVARYRPLEEKAHQVTALSGLIEGTGADNRLRMRLSAFVLAERLRQVIDAANARLEVISEGRYVLHYQEERGAGESRGGLSLSILDEWTGIRRDPATLSGGETFVVSLCLALGLADTVADETGGLRIDTLFIDEGFGSLDAQTLDSVIDILNQLSQGGRVTGVVSHVLELKERLPAVLEVVHSKAGSTVRRASA